MCRNAGQARLTSFVSGIVMVLFAATGCVTQQQPIFVDQGLNWDAASRADFYTRDQGSRMIPLAWLQALKQPNGQPFLADSLSRYGYLPNPANRQRTAGRLHGVRADRPADRGHDLLGLPYAADHYRGQDLPDRRRPRHRRLSEPARGPRHRGRPVLASDAAFRAVCR